MTGRLGRLRRLFVTATPAPRLLDRFLGPLDEPVRLLFEHPSAGRAVADRHGRIVRANARLQRMVGGALKLVPGTSLRDLFAEAERDGAWSEIAALLHWPATTVVAAAGPWTIQLVGDPDRQLIVSIVCSQVRGPAGVVDGVLLSAHDVSLQSRLEAQVAQSQRLQAAGQLAGGVAHDFNNLLTAIVGAANAIAARSAQDEETLEDIEAIRASTGRGAALVRHLLAFGRQQTFQPRVLAVNEVVTGLAGMLRRMLGPGLRLELALERPGRAVRADPTALDQVLVNLAVNARDAMGDEGTLTLRTGELTLHRPLPRGAETVPPGSYVMIEVQDTGAGIPPEVLPRIFEPFFTTRRDAGGTGLGLSTVHGIVRQSGGFLAVESLPGDGTRMRVYLPAWQGEPVEAVGHSAPAAHAPRASVQPPLPFPEPLPSPRRAVLLVDDEDVLRRVAERALAREGWHVLAAPSGETALELLATEPPPKLAAVVSDVVMPGMDGADLVRAVRAQLGRPNLPAVLVSGYAGQALRDKLAVIGAGQTRFLAKPYELKDLSSLLAEIAE